MKFFKAILTLFLLLALMHHTAEAGNGEGNSTTNIILTNIFNFNFEEAEKELTEQNINPTERELLLIELNWWKAIEQGERHHLKQFYENIRQIRENTDLVDNSYMDLIATTYILRYHMATKNYPASAVDYYRIKRITNRHIRSENSNNLSGHLFSLYTSLIKLTELSYNFSPFKNEMSIREQKEKYIHQIQQHTASENFIRSTLGHYFLYKYYNDLSEDDQQAEYHRIVLLDRFPGNPFFSAPEQDINQIITNNMK